MEMSDEIINEMRYLGKGENIIKANGHEGKKKKRQIEIPGKENPHNFKQEMKA